MSLEPHIDENQIIRSLSHWSRLPTIGGRQNYVPQGWPAPAIRIKTQEAYDHIMVKYPNWIPMHWGNVIIEVLPPIIE